MVLTLGRTFSCYWIIIWFSKADTASSTRCYCSISRINNHRFSPHSNPAKPCIPWSRLTHILPCHRLTYIVWALVCATTPPVRSPTKASAILNESVTAVTASRFFPVKWAGGKQSKRYECQLLRKANTVWRNPGMTTDDICLMFTWALK